MNYEQNSIVQDVKGDLFFLSFLVLVVLYMDVLHTIKSKRVQNNLSEKVKLKTVTLMETYSKDLNFHQRIFIATNKAYKGEKCFA